MAFHIAYAYCVISLLPFATFPVYSYLLIVTVLFRLCWLILFLENCQLIASKEFGLLF